MGVREVAVLTIRDVDDELKAKLRVRAAHNGRSMEAEVRDILATALAEDETPLGTAIAQRFAKYGGIELELPDRTAAGPIRGAEFS